MQRKKKYLPSLETEPQPVAINGTFELKSLGSACKQAGWIFSKMKRFHIKHVFDCFIHCHTIELDAFSCFDQRNVVLLTQKRIIGMRDNCLFEISICKRDYFGLVDRLGIALKLTWIRYWTCGISSSSESDACLNKNIFDLVKDGDFFTGNCLQNIE